MLLLQTLLPLNLPLIGRRPDFLLVTILVIALLHGSRYGSAFGLLAGLLQDLFLGGLFGVYTIVKAITGGLSGFIDGKIYKENFILPPLVVFISTIIHEFLLILLSEKLLFNLDFIYFLQKLILPAALVNAIFAFFVYLLFYRINKYGGRTYGR